MKGRGGPSPMVISGRVIGAEAVVRRFAVSAPESARSRVRTAVRFLGLSLQRLVVTTNLAGGVLNKRTGRLQRSVNTRFAESGDVFRSATGSKLVYGRAWELGFQTRAFDIYPKAAQALAWPGGIHPVKVVHRPAASHAARPWLRPALESMRPEVNKVLKLAMRGL
jgi:hypothetical protein